VNPSEHSNSRPALGWMFNRATTGEVFAPEARLTAVVAAALQPKAGRRPVILHYYRDVVLDAAAAELDQDTDRFEALAIAPAGQTQRRLVRQVAIMIAVGVEEIVAGAGRWSSPGILRG
jgi:hypothetical protein